MQNLAAIFDPIGLVSPVVVPAKILFQELCVEKIGWDEPLPAGKILRLKKWEQDLKTTSKITLPRCYYDEVAGEVLNCSLHGFGDASKIAYPAVIYLVYKTTKGTCVKLVASKTRIAPVNKLSIPRLGLMSAKILVTVMHSVRTALRSQIEIESVRYWLDSQTVLHWINNNSEWKQFVQHRVNEILRLSSKCEWGHVSGLENPAYLGSRGVSATTLKDNTLW